MPIVQTGMGWVAGPRLVSATADAGALGILASATMTYDQLAAAIREVKARTDRPFGVNLRADAEDADARVALLVREHVQVASFALAPREHQIKTLKDAGIAVVPSIGARRHAEKVAAWGVDAVIVQGGEGGGHTGAVATHAAAPAGRRRGRHPGDRRGRLLRRPRARRRARVRRGRRRDGHPLPAHAGEHRARLGEAVLPRRTVADTVVTARIDGVPHRVLRTEFVDELEHTNAVTSLPRALRNAVAFKKMSGTSWRGMVARGPRDAQGGRT